MSSIIPRSIATFVILYIVILSLKWLSLRENSVCCLSAHGFIFIPSGKIPPRPTNPCKISPKFHHKLPGFMKTGQGDYASGLRKVW
jgi:hypothetical protein